MAQHPDVLIIGGGVIGLTTAWYLAGDGARVALVDQGEIGRQASWAGAGILPPAEVSHARSALDLLRAHSIRLYPEISRQLRDETGIDNGYAVCGGIELPEGDDDDLPTEEWHGEGVAFERLDRAGLDRHQTGLSAAVTRGVYLPGMAQVRNPWHLRALQAGCARRGVTLTPGWPVERFVLQGTGESRRVTTWSPPARGRRSCCGRSAGPPTSGRSAGRSRCSTPDRPASAPS